MITPDVRAYIDRSVLCWLATVDPEGMPNVSPKEVFTARGTSELLIAHIASPQSVRNLRRNPNACVSFVDIFVQKGYKLQGQVEVIDKGDPRFPDAEAPLRQITQGRFPIHSVIVLTVKQVSPIAAPSYRLFPQTTEQDQIASAMSTYGVLPRPS